MILPSILSASHLKLYEQLKELEGVAPFIHVDIEDGLFVPNLSFGPKMIEEIYQRFHFKLDIHYMVKDPQRFIDIFKNIPQRWISYPVETGISPEEIIFPDNVKIGVAINPDTKKIEKGLFEMIDFLVIMGVYPGFGGAKFEESTYTRVSYFDELKRKKSYNYDIVIDGGVTLENIAELKQSGADHFVVGAGIFGHNPKKAYLELKKICE
ncbi:MAG: ribulose-phosphate 3-epimerase [Candidatus Methanofastidiosia archaeon]